VADALTLFDLDPAPEQAEDEPIPPYLQQQIAWELKHMPTANAGGSNFTPAAVRHVCAERRMPVPLWAQHRDVEEAKRCG
jgi:hypothetical protein